MSDVLEEVVEVQEEFEEPIEFEVEEHEVVEAPEVKLFGRWTTSDVQVNDISLCDYLPVKDKFSKYLPHSAGRYQVNTPILKELCC